MKRINNEGRIELYITGVLSETHGLFIEDVQNASEVVIDLKQNTYMNSTCLKAWIVWTMQIDPDCAFILRNCPEMILNQINSVRGFLPSHSVIESVQLPFNCRKCDQETLVELRHGKHYRYVSASEPLDLNLPSLNCQDCGHELESEFAPHKIFAFLRRRSAA